MVVRYFALLSILASALGIAAQKARADQKIDYAPLNVGATLYYGQLFNIDSVHQDAGGTFQPTVTIPYTSLWMIQRATVNERLKLGLGVAGSFFYPFPEWTEQAYFSWRAGGVAIAEASGSYSFGDMSKPWLEISVGQQWYKYNPYAKNFGEYLYRSEAYPTSVRTGDWGAIDNAAANIWGIAFKGKFLDGLINNDVLVSFANERIPLHDLSLTNITTLNFGKVFSIGGGIMLSRLIQVDRDKSEPKQDYMGYFTWTDADAQSLRAYVAERSALDPASEGHTSNFSKFKRIVRQPDGTEIEVLDTALEVGTTYWAASQRPLVTLVSQGVVGDTMAAKHGVLVDKEYIDTRTIMAMGRFSFDPKPLFGWEDALGANDLVLYGEAAVLGFTNYPIFYKSITERLPVMLGFYVPTFRLLDYLAVEVEVMQNPYMNSSRLMSYDRRPVPKSPVGALPMLPDEADPVIDGAPNAKQYRVKWTEDDFKWTVTALRSFGVWNAAFQVGRDHFRPLTKDFAPSYTEAMVTKDSWYYMFRLAVNL